MFITAYEGSTASISHLYINNSKPNIKQITIHPSSSSTSSWTQGCRSQLSYCKGRVTPRTSHQCIAGWKQLTRLYWWIPFDATWILPETAAVYHKNMYKQAHSNDRQCCVIVRCGAGGISSQLNPDSRCDVHQFYMQLPPSSWQLNICLKCHILSWFNGCQPCFSHSAFPSVLWIKQ